MSLLQQDNSLARIKLSEYLLNAAFINHNRWLRMEPMKPKQQHQNKPLPKSNNVRSKLIISKPLPPKHFAAEEKSWLAEGKANLPHPVWSKEEVEGIKQTHYRPKGIADLAAYSSVKCMRTGFDLISGYSLGFVRESGWLNRIIFLETVAGVPGLVGAMVRHLKSLRRMERDYGWIHTLLEEAENERMHLMTALQIKHPGIFFRMVVAATQGIFLPLYLFGYLVSPHFAHRFVGYLEEEAVRTYTHLLETLEGDTIPGLKNLKAPTLGRIYWQLAEGATFADLILAIRADESHHRDVNHTFATMKTDEENPFLPGY